METKRAQNVPRVARNEPRIMGPEWPDEPNEPKEPNEPNEPRSARNGLTKNGPTTARHACPPPPARLRDIVPGRPLQNPKGGGTIIPPILAVAFIKP